MDDFASRFDNKIDAKGRVSVPASFRAVLSKEGAEEIFCYPHLDRPALEAGGGRLVEKIKGILDGFPIDSAERDEIATAYFGESEKIKVDPDGRAVLPKRLRDHAGIGDTAVFVGLGDKFQIWEPSAYEEFRTEARERARTYRRDLGAGNRPLADGRKEGVQE
jgi:transcriptional regulator MraZ